MRLKPLPPEELDPLQKALYDRMIPGIDKNLKGFVSKQTDGALVGPFNPFIHFPQFGGAAWDYNVALAANSTLPKTVREIAILVTGAHFTARYEIYAHERVGLMVGLSESKIATISAGQRPVDLSIEEGLAYDVAAVLTKGGQLPESLFNLSVKQFGNAGVAELSHLIGLYCLVSVLLNAYDIPVPDQD